MRDETLLAFDFGVKRIGVAVGERRLSQARALTTIIETANEARFSAIAQLLAEWQPARLLVGRPLNEDGTAHEMTARCERFAHQLEGRFRLPVIAVDERFSSLEADAALRRDEHCKVTRHGAQGPHRNRLSWRERKDRLDAEAARVILQSWFDSPPTLLLDTDSHAIA